MANLEYYNKIRRANGFDISLNVSFFPPIVVIQRDYPCRIVFSKVKLSKFVILSWKLISVDFIVLFLKIIQLQLYCPCFLVKYSWKQLHYHLHSSVIDFSSLASKLFNYFK